MSTHETLKTLRAAQSLSQTDVAKALGLKAHQLVSNWERACSKPNLEHMTALADLYRVSLARIIAAIKNTHSPSVAASAEAGS